MSKIKICGMQRIEDIEIVNGLLPDYVGFIMSAQNKFRRQVTVETAKKLSKKLNPHIKAVGVFVDEPVKFIRNICSEDIIDLIQLHGHEDNDYINALAKNVKIPIIKAVHVKIANDITEAENLDCDYLLLDTAYKDKIGGGGQKFNWNLIPKNVTKPFFLAGGLSAENIKQAIETVNPYAVDLSSSVETDGYKDREKVREVIDIVRRM